MSYKLLIAEDEPIERASLSIILSQHFPDIEILTPVTTGAELIEVYRQSAPDLMLIDIQMPGMSGLESIRKLKEAYEIVPFSVLTAHSKFEFAQEALKLGAVDYLLKPIRTDKLIECVTKMIAFRASIEQEAKQASLIQKNLEFLRAKACADFVYALKKGAASHTVAHLVELLGLQADRIICCMIHCSAPIQENLLAIEADFCAVFSRFAIMADGETIILFHTPEAETFQENSLRYFDNVCTYSLAILQRYQVCLELFLHSKLCRSYGELCSEFKHLERLKSRSLNSIVGVKSHTILALYELEKELAFAITQLNETESARLCEKLLADVFEMTDSIEECAATLSDTANVIRRVILSIGKNWEYPDLSDYLNKARTLAKVKDKAELSEAFRDTVDAAFSFCREYHALHSQNIVEEAIRHIHEAFTTDISLSALAERYHVSPSVLSKLLKLRLKKNFVAYITDLRMEKAKELLLSTDMTIKEITYAVGYNSQTYFCKVFKREVGVVATDYKAQCEVE